MDTFSIAALSVNDHNKKAPDFKSLLPNLPPTTITPRAPLPSINEFFADFFRFFSMPRMLPPPIPPHFPPLQTPPRFQTTKEIPLDLSRKTAITFPATSGSTQRKSKVTIGSGASSQNNHHGHHHHHHHGSGKQPIPREHQSSLQREFTQNRSWKTCSLENISVQQLQATLRKGSVERTGYPCPHCEYFAKWPTELQKHIMVHSKERPHQCIICGLTYKWKWDLGRHFDKSHHHAVNPYKKTCFSMKVARQQQQNLTKQSLGKKYGQKAVQNKTTNNPPLNAQSLSSTVPPLLLSNFLPQLPNSYFERFYGY
nr:zinc finger protein 40 [Hymenolepis microstoma]